MQDDQNQQPQDNQAQETVQQDAGQQPTPQDDQANVPQDDQKATDDNQAPQPEPQEEQKPEPEKEPEPETEPQVKEEPKEQTEPEPAAQPQQEEAPKEEVEEKTQSSEPEAPQEEEAKQTEPTVTDKPKDNKDGAHWYVVHTYSGHEAKVAATLKQRVESQKLQDKILDILVPTQEKIEIKEGKKNTIKEKIFPGYLLIRMVLDDNTWLAVRTTPGITSFVGNANKPTPLPESEVEGIKKFMAMEAPKFKATFSVGEAVRITDGPFSEFLGSINEIDEEKGKLKVMVSIFGRETPVELDFLQVAKL